MLFYLSATEALISHKKEAKRSRWPSAAPSLGLTCGAQGFGFELKEEVASFPSLFCFKIDLCHVPIIVFCYSTVVMWQLAIIVLY